MGPSEIGSTAVGNLVPSEPGTFAAAGARIVRADSHHAVASLEHLLVSAWRDPAPQPVVRFADQVRHHCAIHRDPVVVVRLLESTPPPGDVARNHLRELFFEVSRGLRALIIIGEGDGFGSAANRAAASSLRLESKAAFPVHFFESLEDSLSRITRVGRRFGACTVTTNEVHRALESVADEVRRHAS